MGLIKAEKAPLSAVPFSMRDVEEQARAIVLRARRQAEQILAEAQQQGQELRCQAHAQGFEQGRTEGLAQGLKQGEAAGRQAAFNEHGAALTNLIGTLSAASAQLDESRRRLQAEALAEVIGLAVAIARRATKLAGAFDPAVLTENMSAALRLVVHASDVRVALNPAQKHSLFEALPELKLRWPNLEHVELVGDESIAPGGCRIHTRHGTIDADLDEQVNRIAAELLPRRPAADES
jgi:flagellar assembly protein FliH